LASRIEVARSSLLLSLLLAGTTASAALEGPGVRQFIQAARTTAPPQLDGRLVEPEWTLAPVFSDFVQIFPQEGAAPGARTEVRVLYSDAYLYIGLVCHEPEPDRVLRRLGRRDQLPSADRVSIYLDTAHDHRTAYRFSVGAGGTLADALIFDDVKSSAEWDAVWSAHVAQLKDGWSIEIAIPLTVLRFTSADVQTWGFGVERFIARTNETSRSVLIPNSANGLASRLGHLTGLEALSPRTALEITPYIATRAVLRPQYSDPARPDPRLMDPSADVGLELKASLTSSMTLNATVNPDFGQVEADQLISNLSNVETFYPEKRPFFLEGMDLFQPVGAEGGRSLHTLFYTRRIGLTSPIFAAAKLTGTLAEGVEFGVLDAVVSGPFAATDEDAPDRRLRFHPSRPLHLGPNSALPSVQPTPENFLAAVGRARLTPSATVGVQVTSAVPLARTCTEDDAAQPLSSRPPGCTPGGNAAALSWDLRTSSGEWVLLGQLSGSQAVKGPPSRLLRDGTELKRGGLGFGTFLKGGKLGGEPFRFELNYNHARPTLELNPTGFLALQNLQGVSATARFLRTSAFGPFLNFNTFATVQGKWSTDGRGTPRGKSFAYGAEATLPGFHLLGFELGAYDLGLELREIPAAGIGVERRANSYLLAFGNTDSSKPLSVNGTLILDRHLRTRTLPVTYGGNAALGFQFRPQENLETELSFEVQDFAFGPRWIDSTDERTHLFGDLVSRYLSVTLRQQLVLTPRLSLQAYAQYFTEHGIYGGIYQGTAGRGGTLRYADLVPTEYEGAPPDYRSSFLNVNLVLRWDYRLGSTLFVVYTRGQAELPLALDTRVPTTLRPVGLFSGPVNDGILVKWTYWWSP